MREERKGRNHQIHHSEIRISKGAAMRIDSLPAAAKQEGTTSFVRIETVKKSSRIGFHGRLSGAIRATIDRKIQKRTHRWK